MMEKKKYHNLHMLVPIEIYQRLKKFAVQNDRTVTREILRAINLYLERVGA
jgi:hypothetical protein